MLEGAPKVCWVSIDGVDDRKFVEEPNQFILFEPLTFRKGIIMVPKECASLIVGVADRHSFYDHPNAIDETIYLLAWYLWDIVNDYEPQWSKSLIEALGEARSSFTRKQFRVRRTSYSKAKLNQDGGGPGWHIARVFQGYVFKLTPPKELDIQDTMNLSVHLAALMSSIQALFLNRTH